MTVAELIERERTAWEAYRFYCLLMKNMVYRGSNTGFYRGDAHSHALWRTWKDLYERLMAARPRWIR